MAEEVSDFTQGLPVLVELMLASGKRIEGKRSRVIPVRVLQADRKRYLRLSLVNDDVVASGGAVFAS